MTARRSLSLKIVLSVLVAFAVSLVVTWCVCAMLSTREADRLVNRAFDDVESAIGERVNARLVRQAMAVRERLADGAKTDVASLGALARELRITEICVADANGVIVHSSDPDYLGFDFSKAEGQAAEMMCLLNTTATEFCQTFQPNTPRAPGASMSPSGGRRAASSRLAVTGLRCARWHVRRSSGCRAVGTLAARVASSSSRRPGSSSPTTPCRTARGRSGRAPVPASTGGCARLTVFPST